MHRLIKFVENPLLNKHLERQATSWKWDFWIHHGRLWEAPQIIVAELEHSQAINRIIDWNVAGRNVMWPYPSVSWKGTMDCSRKCWCGSGSNRGALPRLLRDKMKLFSREIH
ncbi:MAG: hypothetical protein Ct9H300mP28_02130 [Pseudomonadota bacterium]|nr:MAG: hypothetical protein Ct9H300mP28_02130 [Pseudomonadota bacterium]